MVLAVALGLSWPIVNRSPHPGLARSTAASAQSAFPDPVLWMQKLVIPVCVFLFRSLRSVSAWEFCTEYQRELTFACAVVFFSYSHPLLHCFSRDTHQAISHLTFPRICWATSALVATSDVSFLPGQPGWWGQLGETWSHGLSLPRCVPCDQWKCRSGQGEGEPWEQREGWEKGRGVTLGLLHSCPFLSHLLASHGFSCCTEWVQKGIWWLLPPSDPRPTSDLGVQYWGTGGPRLDITMEDGLSCPQNSHMVASEPKWLVYRAFSSSRPVLNQAGFNRVKTPCSGLINSAPFSSVTLKNIMSHNGSRSFYN